MSNLTLKKRLLVLPLCFFAGLLLLQLANLYIARMVNQKVVLPNFSNQMLEGHQRELKSLVDAELAALAPRLKAAKSREEQIAMIIAETDPIRFFSDRSGYYFAYDMSGVRINVPINKSQNGQNLITLEDKKGFRLIQGLVDKAREGGGFVQYHFDKEGKGVQPKLRKREIIT